MTNEEMKKLNDRTLITIIKDPNTEEFEYQKACNVLLDRYDKQIHKNWWVLQKQLGNSDLVNAIKDEYYDEAYEALFMAIKKVEPSKIENDDWRLVGMSNWYLTNVRTKLIKEVRRAAKIKSTTTMAICEDEDSNTIDNDVERAYQNDSGYKEEPGYIYEQKEAEEFCEKSVRECKSRWSEQEQTIYDLLEAGNSRADVARLLNIPPAKIYTMTAKMCKELKKALNYA